MNKFLLVDFTTLYLAVARKKKKKKNGQKRLKKRRQDIQEIINQLMNVKPVQYHIFLEDHTFVKE